MTVSEHEDDLYAALRVGAAGYLLKDMPPADLVAAVLHAGHDETTIAPRMAARMLTDLTSDDVENGPAVNTPHGSSLSTREHEVLELLAKGLTNREIATRLFIGEPTVKTHVRHVLEKLHLRNRAEAAAFAARREIRPSARL